MAGAVQNLGTNIQKLRDTQDKILGENFLASTESFLSEFKGKLKFDKTSWQNDEQLRATKEQFNTYLEEYKAIAKKQGYDPRIANAYITAAQKRARETDFKFLEKNVKYQEEQTKEYFLQGLDTKSQNNARNMTNGDYKKAFDGFFNRSNELFQGAKEGYLDPSKVVDEIVKERKNLVEANISSIVNQPGSLDVLKNMSKWNFQNFDAYYNQLNMRIEGQDLLLNEDDFKAFQTSVHTAMSRAKALAKANEENTKINALKAETKRYEQPLTTALKDFKVGANEPLYTRPEVFVAATNNANGTNFKNFEEIKMAGVAVPIIEKNLNDRSTEYNSEKLNGAEVMGIRLKEAVELVGGWTNQDDQDYILDSTYGNGESVIPVGSVVTRAYATNKNFRKVYDSTYDATNREILKNIGPVDMDMDIFPMIEGGVKASDILSFNGKPFEEYIENSTGAFFNALNLSAISGDLKSKRAVKDLEQLVKDKIILQVYNETGGILTEDLAKDTGIETGIGLPIASLSKSQKNKIIEVAMKDSQKSITKSELGKTLKEVQKGFTTIDLGNMGYLNVGPGVDPDKTQKAIVGFTQTNDLLDENGRLVPKKQIRPMNQLGSNMIVLTYQGKPVYTVNKKKAILKVGDN